MLYGVSSKNINRLQRIQNAWLDESLTRKFIVVQTRCYISYTGCLSVIVLTSNCKACVPRLLICHQFVPQIISHPISAIPYAYKILVLSMFPGQQQSLVRARFASRRLPFLILSLRTLDRLIATPCRLLKSFYFCNTFDEQ